MFNKIEIININITLLYLYNNKQKMSFPDLFAFDLDYTIWPFDCDKNVVAPFHNDEYGNVFDRYGTCANPYPDVAYIIGTIIDYGIPIAFVSRNPSRNSILQLLNKIPIVTKRVGIKTLGDALCTDNLLQAYSSKGLSDAKNTHFAEIKKHTCINFNKMIFFDDLPQNIEAAKAQGTTSILVNRQEGLTWAKFTEGVEEWRARKIQKTTLDDLAIAIESITKTE